MNEPNTKLRTRERICWKCGGTFHDIDVCPTDGSKLLDLNPDDLADPMIGSLFDGKYRIVRKLGEGGMGNVYAGRQIDFEREVALKILKADYLRDENIKRRFMYEARTISNLRHPNSVRLFDFGQAPPQDFYMVMELLEGESLADRLTYRFLTYREILDIVPPICGVLGEAHIADVVHRDLKPENIFLCKIKGNAEAPKLLDFGIAKHLTDDTMTKSGTLWGTPAYMSPEQAKGDVVGAPADIYAIAVILYELISGNLPFSANTQMGLAMKHISVPARPLSSIPGLKSVPPELDYLILRALQKDPSLRPVDMEEFATELERIRTTCFNDALLDSVPAEEVDAIALQQWLLEEAAVEDELPRASGQFMAMPKPDISGELAVHTEERRAPDTLDLPRLVTTSSDVLRVQSPAKRYAIVAGVLSVLGLAAFGGYSLVQKPTPDASANAVQVVEVGAEIDPTATTTAAGNAASLGAAVVFHARTVALDMPHPDAMDFDDNSPRPRRTPKRPKTAEPVVKKALEKTF